MKFTTEKAPVKPEHEKIEIHVKGKKIGYATLDIKSDGRENYHVVLTLPDAISNSYYSTLVQGHGETIEKGVFNAITNSKAGAYEYIAGIEELQKQLFD